MTAVDVVIIGSGIGGLSCASVLATYGLNVVVCESHYHAGGAAHSFEIDGFKVTKCIYNSDRARRFWSTD